MSKTFGPARQIGYVVDDLDAAIDRWVRSAGVGPFFRMDHLPLDHFRVCGRDVPVDLSVAMANTGEIQIELIQQHNPEPSPYKDFLDRKGPGMQHLGMWSKDYDADIARLVAEGHRVAFEGQLVGGVRFTYFDAPYDAGTFMEVAEMTEASAGVIGHIRAAALNWDGLDPVRSLAAVSEQPSPTKLS